MRGQRGQTTAELTGVLLIVAALMGALLAASIQTPIAQGAERAICKILSLECEPPQPPPRSECVVEESSDKVTINGEFNVRYVKVKLEGGIEYLRQTRANGEVAVTVKLPTSGGVGLPMSKALKFGAEFDAAVKAGQTPQVTFVLPDGHAADTFERQLTDSAIAIAAGPIGSRLIGKRVHVDVPPVESVTYELTSGGNASIGVDSTGGYANGSLDLGQAYGIRKNLTTGKPNSGDITAYYRLDGKLKGEGGLLVGEGGGGALAGSQQLAVTFDAQGRPKGLQLLVSGSYEGTLQLNGRFKDVKTALGAINSLKLKANTGAGQKLQVQVDLALDDPALQQAALDFLRGSGSATRLRDAIMQNAAVQVRTYDTDSTTAGAGLDFGLAGGGVTYDSNDAELTGALDYVPGVGFVPSQVCVR